MSGIARFKLIQPTGTLTAANASELRQTLENCIQSNIQVVLLDLKDVRFIDSFGLGILVSMQKKLQWHGSKLYLCAPHAQMNALLAFADVTRIFEIFPDQATFRTEIVQKHRMVLTL